MSRRMQCPATGKAIYFSEPSARQEIEFQAKKKVYLVAYLCKQCGFIHMATRRRKRGKGEIMR